MSTKNNEVPQAEVETARQQPIQTIGAFLCDVRTLARRVYRGHPVIEEQMLLTSFIEGFQDAQLRWKHRKSKPASPYGALALEVELNAFVEMDLCLTGGSQSTVNKVSTTPPQTLMATTHSSQADKWGTSIQLICDEFKNALPQTSQNSSNSRSSGTRRLQKIEQKQYI